MSAKNSISQIIKEHSVVSMLVVVGPVVATVVAAGPDFCTGIGLPQSLFPRTGQVLVVLYVEALFFVWLNAPPQNPAVGFQGWLERQRVKLAKGRHLLPRVAVPVTVVIGLLATLMATGVIRPGGVNASDLLPSTSPSLTAVIQPECEDANREVSDLLAFGKRHFERYTEDGLRSALGCYQRAMRLDPTSALAHARTAQVWSHLADEWVSPATAYPNAKKSAETAVRLNPRSAEAHSELGKVLLYHEWNFAESERHLRHAIQLNQNYGDAHARLADLLFVTGRARDALAEIRIARRLDPLSAPTSYFLFLMSHGRQVQAIQELESEHTEDNPSALALRLKGDALVALGRFGEALAIYEEAATVDGSMLATRARIARAHALDGSRQAALRFLGQVKAQGGKQYVRAEQLSLVYLAMGDTADALTMLERAFQDRSAGLRWLLLDPGYKPLHNLPRFRRLVARVGVK